MTKNIIFFIAFIFYPRKVVKQDSYMTFHRYVAALQCTKRQLAYSTASIKWLPVQGIQ